MKPSLPMRARCEASWSEAKRDSGALGHLRLTPTSAAGWMLERARVEDTSALYELEVVAASDAHGLEFWRSVRAILVSLGEELAPASSRRTNGARRRRA